MDREHMAENDIDPENVIRTDRNGCLVTVYFARLCHNKWLIFDEK